VADRTLRAARRDFEVRRAELGDDAGVVGAALLGGAPHSHAQ
jgi:hypothetical protein